MTGDRQDMGRRPGQEPDPFSTSLPSFAISTIASATGFPMSHPAWAASESLRVCRLGLLPGPSHFLLAEEQTFLIMA